MLFNSLQFAAFFLVVYSLYLMLDHKQQNRMLLVASYFFYGSWDWRFLSLIFISTVLDYFCGIKVYESKDKKKRKFFLIMSIIGNLSMLGFFKYFNFFASNLQELFSYFGIYLHPNFLHIILPVGISFYTFQTMSYTIDIYRKQLKPTRNFLDLALFVSFFPQLIAGPIERAKHLLPQILSPRSITWAKFYKGVYLIFWGLFMKVFVADNLSYIVDPLFASAEPYNGFSVLIALYAFAFQIFCDFAGYSNIARGLGKVMGFDIMVNFNVPYFSLNPREFWQRWHISLSTWLRDYVYIPLGGNRRGALIIYRNLAITMLLGGLWHGAAWTFIAWGAYQGILLIIHRLSTPLLAKIPSPKNFILNRAWFIVRIVIFFNIVCMGWLLFRAESLNQAFIMLKSVIYNFHFTRGSGLARLGLFTSLLLIVQFIQYRKDDLMAMLKFNRTVRFAFYYLFLILIVFFGVLNQNQFIYFQF